MKKYQEMLNELRDKAVGSISSKKHTLKYKNTILVGDNAAGKSELLRRIVAEVPELVYYIDSVNRSFNVQHINPAPNEQILKLDANMVRNRISDGIFNLKDTFGVIPDKIERWYTEYRDELSEMMSTFLGKQVQTVNILTEKDAKIFGDVGIQFQIDGIKFSLSNGYQALMRIFAECILCKKYFEKNNRRNKTIIIDEIDEFLSVNNAANILSFLVESFPKYHFIVSTHSADLIVSALNMNLIILEDNSYEILDANDFNTITDVYTIFNKIYSSKNDVNMNNEMDNLLTRLLNAKASSTWGTKDYEDFININKKSLSNLQMVLYDQVKRWNLL